MRKLKEKLSRAGILKDQNLWSIDLAMHSHGEFSFAMVKANAKRQDYGEVIRSYDSTYVGVYDGHGGHEAAEYVSNHLYRHIRNGTNQQGNVSEAIIHGAFADTEVEFMERVLVQFNNREVVAANGSCCLVGIIHNGIIWIANLGDSRAVLGRMQGDILVAQRITVDHNVNNPVIRNEVIAAHPNDPDIVTNLNNRHQIRGLIEVSRAIGDANLKYPHFRISDQYPRYHLTQPVTHPLITTIPNVFASNLVADEFFIFASDGLWDLLSPEDAVTIVHTTDREGIAKRLIKAAMRVGAGKHAREYYQIKVIQGQERRIYHDDITVVVLFIDTLEPYYVPPAYSLTVRGYRGFSR